MRDLQVIYPYYDNPKMLEIHTNMWRSYPVKIWRNLKIILVDDGSQKYPLEQQLAKVPRLVNLDAYRIKQNIPWNQNGAHNLGMSRANEGWCLSTDIDHVLPYETLKHIRETELDENTYYTFGRRQQGQPEQKDYKRHPNSWLLTRNTYWESGGYDEDFSGWYGSDSVFRRALDEVAKRLEFLEDDAWLYVYDENDVSDANTTEFGRKDSKYYSPRNPDLASKRRNWVKAENPLRFDWEQIK
jgi:hypothetical protein